MRVQELWEKLPQSTKLLLAGLLLVAGVTLWYAVLNLHAQTAETPLPPTPGTIPEVNTSATSASEQRPPASIEAPPPPFFAKPQPSAPTSGETKGETPTPSPAKTPPPLSQAPKEPSLPNPFAPFYVEAPPSGVPASVLPVGNTKRPPSTTPGVPSGLPTPKPLPTGAPVRVPSPPSSPTKAPQSLSRLPTGTPLPLPQVVPAQPPPLPELEPKPLSREVNLSLKETLTPTEAPAPQGERPTASKAPLSPLQAFVQERGLKPLGVLLGPISVVILESKEGYQVLPVGSSLPGSEVVIRSATAESVELALKDETLTLNLDRSNGGEQ